MGSIWGRKLLDFGLILDGFFVAVCARRDRCGADALPLQVCGTPTPLHRYGCGGDGLPFRVCGTPRFCGRWNYTATGLVPTGSLSESAERHGSADRGTTPTRVWCRRAASPDLRNATVLRTMALHRHGCGDDHDNGNDHDGDDHDVHDDAMRHDKLGGSIDVSATGLRSATMRESLHQPISSLYIFI